MVVCCGLRNISQLSVKAVTASVGRVKVALMTEVILVVLLFVCNIKPIEKVNLPVNYSKIIL